MKQATIMGLTFGRRETTIQTFDHNLSRTGLDRSQYDLFICDQGSRDIELMGYLESLKPDYIRKNNYNEGISRALNQLIIRSQGIHCFFMPNDILLPDNWLRSILEYANDIQESAIVGFKGQDLVLPEEKVVGRSGIERTVRRQKDMVLDGMQVFGAILITRSFINTLGYFCEEYHPYGFEDSDICFRAHIAGLYCYYIEELVSNHIGVKGVNSQWYKDNKVGSFFDNAGLHRWRMQNYGRIGLYIPPPPMRDALI